MFLVYFGKVALETALKFSKFFLIFSFDRGGNREWTVMGRNGGSLDVTKRKKIAVKVRYKLQRYLPE